MPKPSSAKPVSNLDTDALLAEGAWVRRLAQQLVASEDAEDLAQQVLVEGLQNPHLNDPASLRAWLAAVARRLASHRQRREMQRRYVEQASASDEAFSCETERRLELQEQLAAAVKKLEEPYRTAVVLRFFEDLALPELAQRIGVSEVAARKRVSRGVHALREQLDAEFNGDRRAWALALAPLASLRKAPHLAPVTPLPLVALMKVKLALASAAALLVAALIVNVLSTGPLESGQLPRDSSSSDIALEQEGDPKKTDLSDTADDARSTREAVPVTDAEEPSIFADPVVRVLRPDGSPAFGLDVLWVNDASQVQAFKLDEDGSAPRPKGSDGARFYAYDRDVGGGFALAAPEGEDVVIALKQLVTLRGRVLEDGRAPERSMALMLDVHSGGAGLGGLDWRTQDKLFKLGYGLGYSRVFTGQAGEFSWAGLLPGASGYVGLPSSHVPLADSDVADNHLLGETVEFTAGQGEVVIKTRRAPSIYGRLVWADDETPISGQLWVAQEALQTKNAPMEFVNINAEGEFAIGLAMGACPKDPTMEQMVEALSVGSITLGLEAGQDPDHQAMGFSREIDLLAVGLPLDLGIIKIQRLPVASIQVVNRDGAPVADALVLSRIARGRSDESGKLELAYLDDDILCAIAPKYSLQCVPVPKGDSERPKNTLLVLYDAPEVNVLTDVGNPGGSTLKISWEKAPFEASPLAARLQPYDRIILQAFHQLKVSKSKFNKNIPGMPGSVQITPEQSGRTAIVGLSPSSNLEIELLDEIGQVLLHRVVAVSEAGEGNTVDLRLPKVDRTSLTLHVESDKGNAVAEGRVHVAIPDEFGRIGVALVDGRRTFPHLKEGTYEFRITAEGYIPTVVTVDLVRGAHRDEIVQLVTARNLKILFTDPNGNHVEPLELEVKNPATGLNLTWFQEPYGGRVPHAPVGELFLRADLGTQVVERVIPARVEELVIAVPSHYQVILSPRGLPFLHGRSNRLRFTIDEPSADKPYVRKQRLGAFATALSPFRVDLPKGSYSLLIELQQGGFQELYEPVFSGTFEVGEGLANEISPDLTES